MNLHPSIKPIDIKPGQELILNVVETAGYEIQGEVVVLGDRSVNLCHVVKPGGALSGGESAHHLGAVSGGFLERLTAGAKLVPYPWERPGTAPG